MASEELPAPKPVATATAPPSVLSTATAPQTFGGWAAIQYAANVLLPRYLDAASHNLSEAARVLSG